MQELVSIDLWLLNLSWITQMTMNVMWRCRNTTNGGWMRMEIIETLWFRSYTNCLSHTSVLYMERVGRKCYRTIQRLSKFTDRDQIKRNFRYK